MQFLANENFPLASVKYLRECGYNITSITEIAPGSKDEQVLIWAKEQQRIIVTFDRDYGELIYHHKLPAPIGILFLRFIPDTPLQPAEYLINLIDNQVSFEEKFTVAELNQIRQRPLPK